MKKGDRMNFEKLKNCMDKLVEDYKVPGVDCIVYKEHEKVFRYFTGMSDIENNKNMDGTELYLIYSMTKMLTCTAALQLFEQGKYKMDDPLSKYLPEFEKMKIADAEISAEEAKKITTGGAVGQSAAAEETAYAKNPILIKHLFTMSAGFDYALKDSAILEALAQGKTSTRELVGAFANKRLCFEPGTRFNYSLCHDVLGALIEVWSGEKFGEYMKKNIFRPLGMDNTFFGAPKDEERLSKMAARYIYDENRLPKRMSMECVYIFSEDYESGGAGLTSCPEDYAVFLDALACGGVSKDGKRILSPETVDLMRTNHMRGQQCEDFNSLKPGYGYGLGVRVHTDPSVSGSPSPLGEFGWDGAAGAFSLIDPEKKISLTYFQHIHNWDGKIQSEIKNALYSCI